MCVNLKFHDYVGCGFLTRRKFCGKFGYIFCACVIRAAKFNFQYFCDKLLPNFAAKHIRYSPLSQVAWRRKNAIKPSSATKCLPLTSSAVNARRASSVTRRPSRLGALYASSVIALVPSRTLALADASLKNPHVKRENKTDRDRVRSELGDAFRRACEQEIMRDRSACRHADDEYART